VRSSATATAGRARRDSFSTRPSAIGLSPGPPPGRATIRNTGRRDDVERATRRRRRRSRSRGGGEFTAATIARARSRATPTRLARAHRDDWRHPSANERKAAAVRSSLRGVSRRARAVKTPRESDDDAFVSPSFRRARDARGRVVATASRPPLAAREDGPENRI